MCSGSATPGRSTVLSGNSGISSIESFTSQPVRVESLAIVGGTRARGKRGPTVPRTVEVLVEIPLGSRNKYEYDKQRRLFVLDRVLHASVHYPTDYGFIPATLALDGDPLDALVLTTEPTFPGCLVAASPIGVLDMRDEKGPDQKILAVSAV